jgi:hypothetical protein
MSTRSFVAFASDDEIAAIGRRWVNPDLKPLPF